MRNIPPERQQTTSRHRSGDHTRHIHCHEDVSPQIHDLLPFPDIAIHGSGEMQSSPPDTADSRGHSTPQAHALVAGGGGQTKRINPLTYNGGVGRVRTPIRRGGVIVHGLDLYGKKKDKKGSISSIFQTSVTALAFLAFGGYLLCLIVQAIRAKNNGLAMMSGAALHANLSRYVFLGRRPPFGKRRKRDSTEKQKLAGHSKNKAPEERQRKTELTRYEWTDETDAKASIVQSGEKPDNQPRLTDGMKLVEAKRKTNTVLMKTFGSNATQEPPEETEGAEFNHLEQGDHSDEVTVETGDDDKSETDNEQHKNMYREDEMEFGHWPLANADDMYRALVMISEGYSLYHQTMHTA
jgi:hypothetical protein